MVGPSCIHFIYENKNDHGNLCNWFCIFFVHKGKGLNSLTKSQLDEILALAKCILNVPTFPFKKKKTHTHTHTHHMFMAHKTSFNNAISHNRHKLLHNGAAFNLLLALTPMTIVAFSGSDKAHNWHNLILLYTPNNRGALEVQGLALPREQEHESTFYFKKKKTHASVLHCQRRKVWWQRKRQKQEKVVIA